jgi:hypothetical protein
VLRQRVIYTFLSAIMVIGYPVDQKNMMIFARYNLQMEFSRNEILSLLTYSVIFCVVNVSHNVNITSFSFYCAITVIEKILVVKWWRKTK